jgi:hypothetical protein
MDRYSLEWCDQYLDSLLDKMGSDYFPLPVKLDRFITITYDFIHKQTKDLEINQGASDQIKNILVRRRFTITKDALEPLKNIWNVPEPADYFRLVGLLPVINQSGNDMIKAKKPATLQEGQAISYARDPFRKASAEYPNVFRLENFFKIDVGDDTTVYDNCLVSYVKEPLFADGNNLTNRIVNLSNVAIEKILLKTADSLRVTTGDVTAASTYQMTQSFGKKNR